MRARRSVPAITVSRHQIGFHQSTLINAYNLRHYLLFVDLMMEFSDFNFSSAEEISLALAQRLKRLRIQKEIAQADMAERMGVSRSTLNTLENTGKASVIAWIKLVQCLGQEGQLQPLFKPVVASIADMAQQQKPARQRVSRTRRIRKATP